MYREPSALRQTDRRIGPSEMFRLATPSPLLSKRRTPAGRKELQSSVLALRVHQDRGASRFCDQYATLRERSLRTAPRISECGEPPAGLARQHSSHGGIRIEP